MDLYTATLELAQLAMRIYRGTATDDSLDLVTLEDTNNVNPTGYYIKTGVRGGVMWFPDEVTFHSITDFTANVFTFTPARTDEIATGDAYIATPLDWSIEELVSAVNQAITDIGEEGGIPQWILVPIVDNQRSYDISALDQEEISIDASNLKRVFIVSADEDDADIEEVLDLTETPRHLHWDVWQGQLQFDHGTAPRTYEGEFLKLLYVAPHAEVTLPSDVISSFINRNLLRWLSLRYLYSYRTGSKIMEEKYQDAYKNAEILRVKFPIVIPRDPHLDYWSGV